MTWKVVRATDSTVISFGPNTPSYEPSLRPGEHVSIEPDMPAFPPPPVSARVKGVADLDTALAKVPAGPMADALAAIRSLL